MLISLAGRMTSLLDYKCFCLQRTCNFKARAFANCLLSTVCGSIFHTGNHHAWSIGLNAAVLDLPSDWKLHPVFHVSLLKPFISRPDSMDDLPPLPPVIDGVPTYKVEQILSHRDRSVGRMTIREYVLT